MTSPNEPTRQEIEEVEKKLDKALSFLRRLASLIDENRLDEPDADPTPNVQKDCFVCTQCRMTLEELEINRAFNGKTRCRASLDFFAPDGGAQHSFKKVGPQQRRR